MNLRFKLKACKPGLLVVLLAHVFSGCSESPQIIKDSRGKVAPEETGAPAESKEVEELAAKIEGY